LSGIVVQQGFNAASGSGLAAATQAEQETGTSVLVATTPGRQHFHQSAAKCWGKFTQNSTTVEVGYNITSVADTNTGIMTVTGSFIMECYDADSTITDPSDSWMVVCFGDQ
jgi:hypothetical protein